MPDLTPERLALRDQAMAEARSDLIKLVVHVREKLADADRDDVMADLTQGLLDQPRWDRLELCSVLGMAVVDLAEVTDE